MRKVTLNDQVYMIGMLDVFQQLHLARKIAPVMNSMGMSISELAKGGAQAFLDPTAQMGIYAGAMDVVSRMSEEDVNYVAQICLSVVLRVQVGVPQPTPVANGRTMMFEDIRLPGMVQLCINVLQENLSDFFPLLNGAENMQSGSAATAATPT